MIYESSYETGRKPFLPDNKRGHWAAPSDFLYACWGLAFQTDIFSMTWSFFFHLGIYSFVPYLLCMALCVVPILLIQSFLGQFSSSGFISTFRIAPLFKGMGYISLAVNFIMLSHMSAFAAIPLFYLFHSMRPTLPWSCESFLEWSKDVPTNGDLNICNNKTYGTSAFETTTITTISPNSTEMFSNETSNNENHRFHIPSVVYFRSLFSNYDLTEEINFSLSWQLVLCMFLVWSTVALIFYKIATTEKMGIVIRSLMWLVMSLLLICLLRLVFLPHPRKALSEYFSPRDTDFEECLSAIPMITLAAFGTGVGNIVSLASYNKFKTNILRFSLFVALGQTVILILFGLASYVIDTHYTAITDNNYLSKVEYHWLLYLASGSVLAELELPHLWSILFFSLLLLSALLIIVIQLFALLTAIFDEFDILRPHKLEVTLTLIGSLFVCSIFFCSNHGLSYFNVLPADALFTQTGLNLLLLLVVLWVYGRVRLQRDFEFMLGQPFANWLVHILRYIAPLGLFIALSLAFIMVEYEHYYSSSVTVLIAAILFIVIPWLFVPGYAIMGILQTTGSLGMRFKRCCRPTDWYPVDTEERQRYEDAMGNMDITHQLDEVGEEDVINKS